MSDKRDDRSNRRSTEEAPVPSTPMTPAQMRRKRMAEKTVAAAETLRMNRDNSERNQQQINSAEQ